MNEKTIENLLESPRLVVDFLPRRVEKDGGGRFFSVEEYFIDESRYSDMRRRFLGVILRLYCYFDIAFFDGEEWKDNPEPELIADTVMKNERYILIYIKADSAALSLCTDDTHMTVCGGGRAVDDILIPSAAAEGLFVWEAGAE